MLENVPVGHVVHAAASDPCDTPPYLPSAQAIHAPVPAPAVYCPTAHLEHVNHRSEFCSHTRRYPAWHSHLSKDDPAADPDNSGQAVHPPDLASLYRFAGQSQHCEPPDGLYLPAAHPVHNPDVGAPSVVENVPSGQSTHTPIVVPPVVALYFPVAQRVQAEVPVQGWSNNKPGVAEYPARMEGHAFVAVGVSLRYLAITFRFRVTLEFVSVFPTRLPKKTQVTESRLYDKSYAVTHWS